MVEVHHDEGVANRIDPESCASMCPHKPLALVGREHGRIIPLAEDQWDNSHKGFIHVFGDPR